MICEFCKREKAEFIVDEEFKFKVCEFCSRTYRRRYKIGEGKQALLERFVK